MKPVGPRWLRRARTLLSVYYAYMLAYRAELILWALANSLPFILMGLWMQAGATGHFGYTPVEFARYFLAVFLVRQLTVVWVVWDFESLVVKGGLSPRLLQPMDPVWRHVLGHIAERGARGPFTLALVALFFALYPDAFWVPSAGRAALFAALVVTSFAARFVIQYTFAMLAFWTERASAVNQLWMMFYLFLSGMIAPLDLFPPAARDLARWTPFPYLLELPVRCLTGRPLPAAYLAQSALVLGAWTLGFLVLNRALWRAGLRRYSGMGA